MRKGFFSSDDKPSGVTVPLVAKCGTCGLYKKCHSPKMPPYGKNRKKIMVIGEAPGKHEDLQGRPFVGDSGSLLRDAMRSCGIDLDRDCVVTNSAVCRPEDNKLPDRAVEYCRPNVIDAIAKYTPTTIILLGKSAVESVIGWLWHEDAGSISRWVGRKIPSQRLNAWVCPTWHPAFLLRVKENQKELILRLWGNHLRDAVALDGKPWEELPEYKSKVKTIFDPDEAAEGILTMAKESDVVSFDYETNMLKPDGDEARIICCSLSDGERSIAFPWHGEAVRAMRQVLLSPTPLKAAYNLKFEDRWTRRIFGRRVKGWDWDGMIAAHVLDNRPGVTGLKFQAFVRLGLEPWENEIKPYMKSEGSNLPNRLREFPLPKLLRYCGMDALLERKVSEIQKEQMNSMREGDTR